uniref:Uncharacterized protein n=1 Tax=Heliothis virescens TaxID=7102 RepID=A0A2A4K0Y4_HELVI
MKLLVAVVPRGVAEQAVERGYLSPWCRAASRNRRSSAATCRRGAARRRGTGGRARLLVAVVPRGVAEQAVERGYLSPWCRAASRNRRSSAATCRRGAARRRGTGGRARLLVAVVPRGVAEQAVERGYLSPWCRAASRNRRSSAATCRRGAARRRGTGGRARLLVAVVPRGVAEQAVERGYLSPWCRAASRNRRSSAATCRRGAARRRGTGGRARLLVAVVPRGVAEQAVERGYLSPWCRAASRNRRSSAATCRRGAARRRGTGGRARLLVAVVPRGVAEQAVERGYLSPWCRAASRNRRSSAATCRRGAARRRGTGGRARLLVAVVPRGVAEQAVERGYLSPWCRAASRNRRSSAATCRRGAARRRGTGGRARLLVAVVPRGVAEQAVERGYLSPWCRAASRNRRSSAATCRRGAARRRGTGGRARLLVAVVPRGVAEQAVERGYLSPWCRAASRNRRSSAATCRRGAARRRGTGGRARLLVAVVPRGVAEQAVERGYLSPWCRAASRNRRSSAATCRRGAARRRGTGGRARLLVAVVPRGVAEQAVERGYLSPWCRAASRNRRSSAATCRRGAARRRGTGGRARLLVAVVPRGVAEQAVERGYLSPWCRAASRNRRSSAATCRRGAARRRGTGGRARLLVAVVPRGVAEQAVERGYLSPWCRAASRNRRSSAATCRRGAARRRGTGGRARLLVAVVPRGVAEQAVERGYLSPWCRAASRNRRSSAATCRRGAARRRGTGGRARLLVAVVPRGVAEQAVERGYLSPWCRAASRNRRSSAACCALLRRAAFMSSRRWKSCSVASGSSAATCAANASPPPSGAITSLRIISALVMSLMTTLV